MLELMLDVEEPHADGRGDCGDRDEHADSCDVAHQLADQTAHRCHAEIGPVDAPSVAPAAPVAPHESLPTEEHDRREHAEQNPWVSEDSIADAMPTSCP